MANIFKSLDTLGICDFIKRITISIRQFFATKSEMDVVTTALTDLDRRIDEAIPTISVGKVTTVDAGEKAHIENVGTDTNVILDFSIPRGKDGTNGTDGDDGVSPIIEIGTVTTVPSTESASVEKTGTIDHVILNFKIPRGKDGDMWELDDEGYVDSNGDKVTDYCTAGRSWQMRSEQSDGYDFINSIEVPIPSVEAMIMLADCINQTNEIILGVVKNPFIDNYDWKELHWSLRCSRTDNIVYTTKYAIPDAKYPTVIDSESNAYFPPTTIEISVSCNKTPGNGARYVQITIENKYGRAYYSSANITKQIIKS